MIIRYIRHIRRGKNAELGFNEENKPMVVFQTSDSVWVVYSVLAPTKENDFGSFIHYRISADGGQSWSKPESLMNDTISGKSISYANAIRLSDDRIAFAWMGGMPDMEKIAGRALYYTTSTGNGQFTPPVLIDSFACPCCRSSLASTPDGKVAIAYRSVRKNNIRDIAFSYKKAGADKFSKPVVFSNDHWQLDACPEDGPSLAITGKENWIGWFTGGKQKGVYFAGLDNEGEVLHKEKTEENSRYIKVARMPDGTRITAYNKNYEDGDTVYGKIIVNKIDKEGIFEKEISLPHVQASYPVMQVAGNKKVIVAWINNERVYYELVNTASIVNAAEKTPGDVFPLKTQLPVTKWSSNGGAVLGMQLNERKTGDTTLY